MRVLRQDLHLYPIVPIVLREASSQCEAIKDSPRDNVGLCGETKLRTDTRRHFDLHQTELTGELSEYEIDAARRRGWM